MLHLDNVAIVTGAAHGIGRATAMRLARDGARVVVTDVDEDAGNEVVEAIKATGSDALFRSADVAERLDVHNLVAIACDAFGRVDILVNNAGVVDDAPFLELDADEFDRIMKTNLRGAFVISQAVAKRMIAQARELKEKQAEKNDTSEAEVGPRRSVGAIVNVTSINAVFGQAHHVAYTVSKGGMTQLTKSMALALAPHGIRVNAVGPGSVDTKLVEDVLKDDDLRTTALQRTPLGRFGTPEEIASVITWLASDQASYLTGTTVWADGGRLALNTMMASETETPPKS